MPRLPRTVIARIPHHVTQRGNRRGQVFFSDPDRRAYIGMLGKYAHLHEVEVLAYCLMPNHVHLVAVPAAEDSLHRALRPLHMRYAQRVNREREWSGHLWQGRFFSSALDEAYLRAAIRYVERNPVRAGLVEVAECYPWSSAAARCGLRRDSLLQVGSDWNHSLAEIGDWSAWLAGREDAMATDVLRLHAVQGIPCGSEAFVRRLEESSGRNLQPRTRGRPRKALE